MKKFYTQIFTLITAAFCLTIPTVAQEVETIKKIVSSNRTLNTQFGYSVDINDSTAVVGALWESYDANNQDSLRNSGAAYILQLDQFGSWNLIQKIVGSNRGKSAFFGKSVAIHNNTICVGAHNQNYDESGKNYEGDAGAVYVFEKNNNGTWVETQNIVAVDRDNDDDFGTSVAIFEDIIVVGANQEDHDESGNNALTYAGSAYIFEKNNAGDWIQTQKIVASDRSSQDRFGNEVAISHNYIVVGAIENDLDENGGNNLSNSGAAYVFEKQGNGTWTEQIKLLPSLRGVNSKFGVSVDIDSNHIIVGARGNSTDADENNLISQAGASYIFKRTINNEWIEQQKIVAQDRKLNAFFGQSVSISKDQIMIGSSQDKTDENGLNTIDGAGSAYIFRKNNQNVWEQSLKIVGSDRGAYDSFGHCVAISNNQVIVGVPYNKTDQNNANELTQSGSAYVFEINNSSVITGQSTIENLNVTAYPNPVIDVLNIELNNYSEHVLVNINSILGSTSDQFSFVNANRIIVPMNYPPGIYLITVRSSQGKQTTFKVIKR